jgi:hypothetical protein
MSERREGPDETSGMVRFGETRDLSTLNTSADIARVLLAEANEDLSLSRQQLYHMAMLHLSSFEDQNSLEDIVALILLMGGRAHLLRPDDVSRFIETRRELNIRPGYGRGPHPGYRKVLADILLDTGVSSRRGGTDDGADFHFGRTSVYAVMNDLTMRYRSVIEGKVHLEPVSDEPLPPKEALPPDILAVGESLTSNFPLLRRVEVKNVDDIRRCVALEELLPGLPPPYQSQLRYYIERRIDERAAAVRAQQTREGDEPAPKPVPARPSSGELLLQARLGRVFSSTFEVISTSYKHVSDKDYERALLSVIARMPTELSYLGMERDLQENNYIIARQIASHTDDPEAYLHIERSMLRERHSDREVHADYELRSQVEKAASAFGLGLEEHAILQRLVNALHLTHKISYGLEFWTEFCEQHMPALLSYDCIAFPLLAYSAGAVFTPSRAKDSAAKLDLGESAPKGPWRVEFSNFNHLTALHASLDPLRPRCNFDEEEARPTFEVSSLDDLCFRMLACYVNNQVWVPLADPRRGPFESYWRTPLRFEPSYTAEDKVLCGQLLRRYPIFSQVPVFDSEDVASGIVLHQLHALYPSAQLMPERTITENLALHQLAAMNASVRRAL